MLLACLDHLFLPTSYRLSDAEWSYLHHLSVSTLTPTKSSTAHLSKRPLPHIANTRIVDGLYHANHLECHSKSPVPALQLWAISGQGSSSDTFISAVLSAEPGTSP